VSRGKLYVTHTHTFHVILLQPLPNRTILIHNKQGCKRVKINLCQSTRTWRIRTICHNKFSLTLMLSGGSSKVSNMYLSPPLSGDLRRTYEITKPCNIFSCISYQKTSPNDFANVIHRRTSHSRTCRNVSTAPLATSSNVRPKYVF
jgi:hypothetical protein